jgi:hypothetical protein
MWRWHGLTIQTRFDSKNYKGSGISAHEPASIRGAPSQPSMRRRPVPIACRPNALQERSNPYQAMQQDSKPAVSVRQMTNPVNIAATQDLSDGAAKPSGASAARGMACPSSPTRAGRIRGFTADLGTQEADSERLRLISSPCEPSCEDANVSDECSSNGAGDCGLKTFANLRQRPSHPKVRSTHRRGRISKPFTLSDRLIISIAHSRCASTLDAAYLRYTRRRQKYGAARDSDNVSKQERTGRHHAITVLNARFMQDQPDQISLRVRDDVALAALDPRTCIIARGAPLSVVSIDWLSITPADGLASRPAASRAAMTSM